MSSRPVPSRLTRPATRRSAAAAGVGDWQLRHEQVERLSRDTYLPRTLSRDLAARCCAVLLTAPPGTVVSHQSAAALWGLRIPLLDLADRRVHLAVPAGSRAESRADRQVHRAGLVPADVTRRRSIPVTTPARTWRDLAGVLTPAALLAVTDQLLDGWCTREGLAGQLARNPSGRGCARARRVLPLGSELAESPMESVLRWLVHAARLPEPVLQHWVLDEAGRSVGRADLAWPDHKVLVEFDGDVHRERNVFVKDVRRQNRLIAAGWRVLRFTSADVLGLPAQVIAEIRRALRTSAGTTR